MIFRLACACLAPVLAAAKLAEPVCDTTTAWRANIREEVAGLLGAQGYEAVSDNGNWSCSVASSSAGAGNPESVTCQFTFGSKGSPLLQIDPTEVIIHLMCAPETSPLYFGFTPYLLGFDALSLAQFKPAGQIVDTLNHLRMNSTAPPDEVQYPWGRTLAVVVSADEIAMRDSHSALVAAGLPASASNSVALPSALLDLGSGLTKNFFMLGARVGPFNNSADEANFVTASSADGQHAVLRFRRASGSTPAPLATPLRRQRSTGRTEQYLQSEAEDVEMGVLAWATEQGLFLKERAVMSPMLRDGVKSNGTECITNRSTAGCFEDTDDCGYLVAGPLSALQGGDIDVVVGSNSWRSGKAVYGSVGVYTAPLIGGQLAVLGGAAMNSAEYDGSANRFHSSMSAQSIYAVVTRYGGDDSACGATEKWCLNATVTDKAHVLKYVSRAYLNPKTQTGPDADELLAPVVLRFRPFLYV